ncbi:hypothetical protein DOK67_0002721 [Enterococcus sp. DIV0212c]|uniref:EutP/PduV family microcompartment system protein n=1 Tax=Enterococcus sp. DIV0212c TaxID=2230867 RepID=UPI001A9AD334|nr:EutP/PduV family microcompartment system protein [Enterococcus sp. DIV0212c]MBO1353349.1 hypothetical protein [Enterococcus sp. DIV0212c]
MKKIMIAGPVGSGKTTLAKKLSVEKAIPFYELDNLIWKRLPEGDRPYSKEESNQQLQHILTKEAWIIEGTTTNEWIKPAVDDANIILLLLPAYPIRVFRILKRFIKQKTKREAAHYQPTLKLLKMMFIWNHHFEEKNIFKLHKLAESSPDKLILLKSYDSYSTYKKL